MTWTLSLTPLAMALAAAALWIRQRLIITEVRGPSMLPTYRDGDRLLTLRQRGRSPLSPGQVVVLANPRPVGVPGSSSSPWLIKRVVAVAGEPVPGGQPDDRVPAGHVVVLGDNPAQSLDSRHLGFIPVTAIRATVLRRMG